MKGSYIAAEIDRDYKREQFYKRKKREKCKEKECANCKFFEICTESQIENEKETS